MERVLGFLTNLGKPNYLAVGVALFWERMNQRLQQGPLWQWRFVGRSPDAFLYSPSSLRPTDALVARDIYQGRFIFSGRAVDAGSENVFLINPPTSAWENDLNGFSWLRHLEAAGTELAAENGRALVRDWMDVYNRRFDSSAYNASVCSSRIISWIQHARFILETSDLDFYRRFMASLAKQIRYLRVISRGHVEDIDLLRIQIALAYAALALPSSDRHERLAARNLEVQLRRQILADGGHISRNPNLLPGLIADLLPLSQVYIAASKPVPTEIVRALDRMFPMLRFFRHTEGSIALFHGASVGHGDLAAAIMPHDHTNGQPNNHAEQSGFHRFSVAKCVAIIDTGKPLFGVNGANNHASALAFEFSSGRNRIVVNAGVDRFDRNVYGAPARTTAAHSTLIVDDHSSASFHSFSINGKEHVRLLRGPTRVESQPWETSIGQGVSVRHDGYALSHDVWHERGLLLSDNGLTLQGYDRLTPDSTHVAKALHADIRFHLHPNVIVNTVENSDVLELVCDNGDIWRFSAIGATPIVEGSIFLAGIAGPVYNKQIVLVLDYPNIDSVQWRFDRADTASY